MPKQTIDLDSFDRLAEGTAPPEDPVARAVAARGRRLTELLREDNRVAPTLHALIVARQLFAATAAFLGEVLAEEDEALQHAHDCARREAAATVDLDELYNAGVRSQLVPWLGAVLAAKQAESVDAEVARRDAPLPLRFDPPAGTRTGISRTRTLVLLGNRAETEEHLYGLVADAQAQSLRTVVLDDSHATTPADATTATWFLPADWHGCADSGKTMEQFAAHAETVTGGPPDLVVCHDLAAAYTKGFVGCSQHYKAGNANRRLRKWADYRRAAVVAAFDCGPGEITAPEFEQLRTFADLADCRRTQA